MITLICVYWLRRALIQIETPKNITTAGASRDLNDTSAPDGAAGTTNETAIDVVPTDKKSRKIYLTRSALVKTKSLAI